MPSGSDRDNHPDGRSSVTMGACPREGSRARLAIVDLLPGVRSSLVDTDRIRMRVLEAGPADGEPVVLVHGNLSTARFYEHLMPELPPRYRVIAPDMRGFGGSDPAPLDATRGLADWADDTAALLRALGVDAPPHLVGWSTGGAAIARFAHDRPVASLTFLDPVSPYGYGGTHPTARPASPTARAPGAAGSTPRWSRGCGRATPPPTARSPRAACSARSTSRPGSSSRAKTCWSTRSSRPTSATPTTPATPRRRSNWPGFAPGTSGILNALSPRYCRWDDIVDLDPKPPVLWTHGAVDLVVADGSPLELGTLGASGAVPGWPGAEVYPPQPMVTQIRAVLDRYAAAGGSVRTEIIEGAGHGPHLDAAPRWLAIFREFLATIG